MTDLMIDPATTECGMSTDPRSGVPAETARRGVPVLDVVIPVYNEEKVLSQSVHRLHRYLAETLPFPVRITIADNASIDDTARVAIQLADELDGVRVVRLEQKGRGRALHAAWSSSDAPVLAYMDVDLSTDLAALEPSVAPLLCPWSPTRGGSSTPNCWSWPNDPGYGSSAMTMTAAIHEVPVDWVDDPDSRVDIVATATADLRGIARMRTGLALGRIPLDDVAAQLGITRITRREVSYAS